MIYLAPLQTYTNLFYINAFQKHIGGISKYYTPFYRTGHKHTFLLEDHLSYSDQYELIPQVLCNSGNDLILFSKLTQAKGFKEINLNLGCPFPMVMNKKLGSGLLEYPEEIEAILDSYFLQKDILPLSIKLRLGRNDSHEILPLIKIINQYPVSEIIIHPRLGKQQYKGEPDWDFFTQIIGSFKAPIIGNGDICSLETLKEMELKYPKVCGWMLGRGLLSNPLMIKGNKKENANWLTKLLHFHDAFATEIKLLNDVQKLNLLKAFWEYPLNDTTIGKRYFRKLKKMGIYENYDPWLADLIKNYSFT